MAQSNGVPKAPPRGSKKYLKDDDLFVCTLNGKTHHVKWSDIETLAMRPPSLWHIKDVSGGTCTALHVDQVFDVQGNRLSGPASEYVVNPGEERIIVGNDVRFMGSTGNWNFGEQTRTEYQFQFDQLLRDCTNFNGDIKYLDVTKFAFNIAYMFANCEKFNQSVAHFDTQNVNTMRAFVRHCFVFNQPLNHFDTGACENFMIAFQWAHKFNQPLGNWDVSQVKTMHEMFNHAFEFNQDISPWNTSSCTEMNWLFKKCHVFNQDLSQWCVSNIYVKPPQFDLECHAWTKSRPVWRTCPRGENQA